MSNITLGLSDVLALLQANAQHETERPLKLHQISVVLLTAFESLIRTTVQHCDA